MLDAETLHEHVIPAVAWFSSLIAGPGACLHPAQARLKGSHWGMRKGTGGLGVREEVPCRVTDVTHGAQTLSRQQAPPSTQHPPHS